MPSQPSFADLIGKPWILFGRGPDAYDCWGIVEEGFRRFGIEVPDMGRGDNLHEAGDYFIRRAFADGQKRVMTGESPWTALHAPKAPCVVLFTVYSPVPTHCGLYIGEGRFIHCRRRQGVRSERLRSPLYKQRIKGIYAFTG